MTAIPRTLKSHTSSTWGRAPLPGLLRLVASIRFAAAVVGGLALLGLVGVLVPQVPASARADPGVFSQWFQQQEGRFGPAANVLYRLGLFDVFHSVWFAAALVLLATSVIACTSRRLAPTWRNVVRPTKTVPDAYLEHAHQRVSLNRTVDAAQLEQSLRHRRYHVERWQAGQAQWLFADRYPWAQLGTFVSHIAIILLIVAGLITHFTGFSARLFIPEGGSQPVFPLGHSPSLNVVLNASLDNQSELTITRNGALVKACTVTTSQTCSFGGYRFRQAFNFPLGADLQVRDTESDQVVYRETTALTGSMPVPRLVISDSAGKVLFDQALALTGAVDSALGTLFVVPEDGRALWAGMPADKPNAAPRLVIFEPGGSPDALRLALPLHGASTAGSLRFEFADLGASSAASVPGLPLPAGNEAQTTLPRLQLLAGGAAADSSGAVLSVTGVGAEPLSLHGGESARVGGLEYTFMQQRHFLGVEVTKDRGEPLIWVASGMLIVGLCITMWLPRRRLWAKVSSDSLRMAGVAPRMTDFRGELEVIAAEAADATRSAP